MVVATADSAARPSAATALRVTLPGLEPTVIPLVQIEGSTVSAAGYAFSQVGGYGADLVGADGAVVTPLTP